MKFTTLFPLIFSLVVAQDALTELNSKIKQLEARIEAHEQLKSLGSYFNLTNISNADIEAAAKLIVRDFSMPVQTPSKQKVDSENSN